MSGRPLRAALLAASTLALAGCPEAYVRSLADVYAFQLPKEPARLREAAAKYEEKGDPVALEDALVAYDKLAEIEPNVYDDLWHAARVATELGDQARGTDGNKARRKKFALKAKDYAQKAIALDGKRGEGHYYLAIALGLEASTKSVGAFDLLPKMQEQAKLAIAADGKIDHAGPHRLMAALLIMAPPWPASVGDVDEGLQEAKKAVELAGDYPPNRLYLGEALMKNDQRDAARTELQAVLKSPPPPAEEIKHKRWVNEARQMLAELEKKK